MRECGEKEQQILERTQAKQRQEHESIPDIFKVAVGGLSRLLLSGQVQLFRELPQSGSMKDPWQRTQTHKERLHGKAVFYRLKRSRCI